MRNRQYRELKWPKAGVDLGRSFQGQQDRTCVDALNVRNFDPRTGRLRGAQRAGVTRYAAAQAGGSATRIQDISQIVQHYTAAAITVANTSIQNSNWISLAVANGVVYTFTTAGFTSKGANLNADAPVIFSAQLFGDMYYADGTSTKLYDSSAAAMATWTPTVGSLPGSGADRARLIEMWRSRIVLSGVRSDPHNFFMSKLGDALDWDYTPTPSNVTQAVAGNNSDAGLVGDVINSMCAYDDDTLLFFCDHSLWQMSGDPAEGGRVDNISDVTGSAFGRPWCRGPLGEVYFVGSRGGIYRFSVGGKPERISSARIEEKLNQVNLNTTLIRPVYDDRTQLVHFFFTPLTPAASTHVVWDLRTESFWMDQFADNNYNPRAVAILEGDAVSDRVVLIGSDDGYLRYIDYTGKDDDQKAINSYVYLGPIQLEEGRRVMMRELLMELDLASDGAYYEVWSGNQAQAAFDLAQDSGSVRFDAGQFMLSGQWNGGRNVTERRRASGRALYIKIGNDQRTQTWAFERGLGVFHASGLSRLRQQRL